MDTDRPHFASSRAKLARAGNLRAELSAMIAAYLESNPYRFITEVEHRGRGSVYEDFIEADPLPPDDVWGPVIGDVVHNLRSSVEHAAWDMARPESREARPRAITFPVSMADDKPFRSSLKMLRPEFHDAVRGLQPFVTGDADHPLRLLTALWNVDKHRAIHITGFMMGQHPNPASRYGFDGWSHGRFDRDARRGRRKLGGGSNSFQRVSEDHAETVWRGQVRDVAIGGIEEDLQEYPYDGLPVRPLLERIHRFVETDVIGGLSAVRPATDP